MKTDTLGRRLRFAPPQPRGKRIDLSERDFAIFETLHRHGPLPTHYLYEFTRHFGRHLTSFQHRLTKLANGTENGTAYLTRPQQQFASYNARCQPIIYDLAAPALAALAERGRLARYVRTDPFLHRFMGATVSASIRLAAEHHGCRYGTKEDIFAHPKCPDATRDTANLLALPIWSAMAGKYLVPDDLFVIQYPGPKPRFFAVEIDRRTESIVSDTAKTAYGRKLHGYVAALKKPPLSPALGHSGPDRPYGHDEPGPPPAHDPLLPEPRGAAARGPLPVQIKVALPRQLGGAAPHA